MRYEYFESIDPQYQPFSELGKGSKLNPNPSNCIQSGFLVLQQTITSDIFLFLDDQYLWCKLNPHDDWCEWRLEMKFIKIILPEEKSATSIDTTQRYCFKLCFSESSWCLFASNHSDLEKWLNAFSKVAIRTDLHKRFRVNKVVGAGAFAKVYEATSLKTKELVAIKGFSKRYLASKEKGKQSIWNEVSILRRLSHQNTAQLREVHETDNSIYLIFDLFEGGDLYGLIKQRRNLQPKEALNIIEGILLGLEHLSHLQVVHRDMKPNNILLRKKYDIQPQDVAITDYGLSTFAYEKEPTYTKCGTPGYVAPEVILAALTNQDVELNPVSDVFGAGVILFMMITGKNPFEMKGCKTREVLQNNTHCLIDFTRPGLKASDPQVISLLKSMLLENPLTRPTAKKCLSSRLFSENLIKPGTADDSLGTEEFSLKEPRARVTDLGEVYFFQTRNPILSRAQSPSHLKIPNDSHGLSSTNIHTDNDLQTNSRTPRVLSVKQSILTLHSNSSIKQSTLSPSVRKQFKEEAQLLPGNFTSFSAFNSSRESIPSADSLLINSSNRKADRQVSRQSHFGSTLRTPSTNK
jgi:serine/threonine protein kinase